jgi:hypothetical protein
VLCCASIFCGINVLLCRRKKGVLGSEATEIVLRARNKVNTGLSSSEKPSSIPEGFGAYGYLFFINGILFIFSDQIPYPTFKAPQALSL